MDKLGERAREINSLEEKLRQEVHGILAEAGSHLLKKPVSIDRADLPGLRKQEADLTGQVTSTTKVRDRIQDIQSTLDDLKHRSGEIKAELRSLSENLDPIYEEIGRLAFNLYRANPLVDEGYASIFSNMVEVHSELAGIEGSIREQQALLEAKPFLEKMVVRGRIALIRNRQATREGAFRRLSRAAGRDIMATGFVDELGDPSLTKAAEPFRERLDATRDREAVIEKIEADRTELLAELEELGGGGRPARRLAEIESDIQTLEQSRDAVRVQIARAVMASSEAELPAKCKPLLKSAAEIEVRVEKLVAVRGRIEAALEARRLEIETGRLQSEIDRAAEKQAAIARDLADLKKHKEETEKKLSAAVRERGSVAELLTEDLLDKI